LNAGGGDLSENITSKECEKLSGKFIDMNM